MSRVNHTIEWWMAQPPDVQERALRTARTYSAKAKAVCSERRLRDDQLRRLRASTQQNTNARKHAKRAIRNERNTALQLWTNEPELTAALQSITGKTARIAALRIQLTAYKQRHDAKEIRLSTSGKQLSEDELKALLLTVIQRCGRFVTQQPAPTTATPPPASAPTPHKLRKANEQQPTSASASASSNGCGGGGSGTSAKRVLQCCGVMESTGDRCVQCDSCAQWFHCACEQVAWEAANSMAVYLCRMCLGELPPVE